ncbi:hypothetical protein EG328_001777 [Venturia inaequalis]|uniref:Uncharacterized protein n=1 Tax=Venturia inaequalis TaxID=5025 RepID=A0A8H3YXX7_VENIN|nr:hypothetical protein EG328_001777 [Venturia inaequalis]RDI80795.1 hypothetical protein Vi05172_g9190 [Venturia inaequalis]
MFARRLERSDENHEGEENKSRSPAHEPASDIKGEEGECHSACSYSSKQGNFHVYRLILEKKAYQQIDEQPASTPAVDPHAHIPGSSSEIEGGVGGGQRSKTHGDASRYTPTVTVIASASTPRDTTVTETIPASTRSQAADITVTETVPAFTRSQVPDITVIETVPAFTRSKPADITVTETVPVYTSLQAAETTSTDEPTTYKFGPHTTTSSNPSATIAIPDFVNEFSSAFEEEWWHGKHSPTSLPSPVASTYIEPTGGVSIVPVNGPTVFMNPSGHVTMWRDSTGSATTETASPTAFGPSIVTIQSGPTVSVDTTGGVSVLTGLHPSPTTNAPASASSPATGDWGVHTVPGCTIINQSFITSSSAPASSSATGGYPVTASSSSETSLSKSFHITKTSTLGRTHTIPGCTEVSQSSATSSSAPASTSVTGDYPMTASSSLETSWTKPFHKTSLTKSFHITKTSTLGRTHTIPGCTVANQSSTTSSSAPESSPATEGYPTTASSSSWTPSATANPSDGTTMFQITKMSTLGRVYTIPGCTIAGESTSTITTITSAGPSTMLRLVRRSPSHYEDIAAATDSRAEIKLLANSLGKAYAGQVSSKPNDVSDPISMKLVGFVIGVIFSLVFVVAVIWYGVKKVQRRSALAKRLAIKGEMEQY